MRQAGRLVVVSLSSMSYRGLHLVYSKLTLGTQRNKAHLGKQECEILYETQHRN